MRNGEKKAVRRWQPAEGEYAFTHMGKAFYSRLKRNFVVQVPVWVKDGTEYRIRSSLPVAKLGVDRVELPLCLTPAQRTTRIKEIVRSKLDLTRPL